MARFWKYYSIVMERRKVNVYYWKYMEVENVSFPFIFWLFSQAEEHQLIKTVTCSFNATSKHTVIRRNWNSEIVSLSLVKETLGYKMTLYVAITVSFFQSR